MRATARFLAGGMVGLAAVALATGRFTSAFVVALVAALLAIAGQTYE